VSAHDPENGSLAHDSNPPNGGKPRQVVVDASGVSMSWKLAGAVLTLFLGSGAVWTTLGLAKLDDLNDHNDSDRAHPAVAESATKATKKLATEVEAVSKRVATNTTTMVSVKNGFYDDRAERLADRAADKIRNAQRKLEVWQEVKAKALDNLKRDRPIRDGLADKL
jgi:hypothetical protein